ncbi:MAG TPA: metal-sensitive transcriptional regulator [Ktedonobacterales bacterium]|nr:metal-sensitive transcriptional regulator [Ktedonobacterales bacterium]
MVTATNLEIAARGALVARLKSIEGQARGIQRMLEDGRDCREILDQLGAMRAASHAVSMQAIEAFALHCLRESPGAPDQVMAEFLGVISKLTR